MNHKQGNKDKIVTKANLISIIQPVINILVFVFHKAKLTLFYIHFSFINIVKMPLYEMSVIVKSLPRVRY